MYRYRFSSRIANRNKARRKRLLVTHKTATPRTSNVRQEDKIRDAQEVSTGLNKDQVTAEQGVFPKLDRIF